MSSSVQEKLYSTGEAAKFLGISQSSVINYIDKGWLKPDLTMPSSGGKSGRRKFSETTLNNFKKTFESKGD